MHITVVGTGYVGLVSGVCFAEMGHVVTCVDKDANKIKILKQGGTVIYEPGLERLLRTNSASGRLLFDTSLENSMKNADVAIIAVGTPPKGDDGGADLKFVFAVAEELAEHLKDGQLVITKSTVPVGTGDAINKIIKVKRPDLNFAVASNPEFLREGCAVSDFLEPDRVVVGIDNDDLQPLIAKLYQPLTDQNIPLLISDIKTAELTKYAANAYLANKITFINEMADLCETLGANIDDVARGIGTDNRIGMGYLKPGPGFGGSCFPKDTLALNKMGVDANCPSALVSATIKSNDARKVKMAEKVISAIEGNFEGSNIAIWGLAFKANTDDARYSPAIDVIKHLRHAGAHVHAHDPEAEPQARAELGEESITYYSDAMEAVKGVDCLVVCTEWNSFRMADLNKVKSLMKGSLVFDMRNIFEVDEVTKAGLSYRSIGRP